MCLCSSACDARHCPICGKELEYRGFDSENRITKYHCPDCNRDYIYDDKKEKWVGITKQQLLLAGIMQFSQRDAWAMRELIFELFEAQGSIQQDSLILHKAIELLQNIQTRIQKQVGDIKERIEYQEKIKPMSKMQRLSLKREREELL